MKFAVKSLTPILTGQLEEVVWLRPEGRGTFQESPLIEKFVTAAFKTGRRIFVIDLESCPGMDSTFMGMLAGLGIKFRKEGEGVLNVVGTSDKTRASLQELGLHYLSNIENGEGPWIGRYEEFRAHLLPIGGGVDFDKMSQENHVLKSHENLVQADDSNLERFRTVLDMMGSQLSDSEGERSD